MTQKWNGDSSALPTKDLPFEYGGNTYRWIDCPCECGRPAVFTLAGDYDQPMTTRIRGLNQGAPFENVIVKFIGMDEFVNRIESGENPLNTWEDLVAEVEPNGTLNEAQLTSRDITVAEYKEAKVDLEEMLAEMRRSMIIIPLSGLGGDGLFGGDPLLN